MALSVGTHLGPYEILAPLGAGGMGEVYRARDTRLEREVAIKILPESVAADAERLARFEREARAASAVADPHIVTVFDVGTETGLHYIVSEFVDGRTLRDRILEGRLPPEEVAELARQIAAGLCAAHERGIIHRDVKPENILLTSSGAVKIADFGLARITQPQLDGLSRMTTAGPIETAAGTVLGTVSYMSPEQAEGRQLDFRADIFSFGVLLYEMASGTRPFDGSSAASTIAKILMADPPPLAERNTLAPPELERIARKCLRKRREERYQSTRDLVVDLEQLRREPGATRVPERPAQTGDAGVLRRVFFLIGGARRWWETDIIFAVFVFAPLLVYLAWKAKAATTGDSARALFFIAALFIVTSAALRMALIILAVSHDEPALAREVRRLGLWIHASDTLMIAVFLAQAVLVWPSVGIATILVGVSVAGLIRIYILDPAMTRAAFPQLGNPPANGNGVRPVKM